MTKAIIFRVNHRNWAAAFLLGGLLALPATSGQAQEAIGSATAVKPQAEGSQGRDTRTLSVGSTVYSRDNIHTGDSGVADLCSLRRVDQASP